jgi:glycosidase
MKLFSHLLLVGMALALFVGCGQDRKLGEHDHDHDHDLPLVQGPLMLPSWGINANIYEVNIRQFTPEGTFKAFEAHLPRLKEMGVDILWFMPIYPISEVKRKGTKGSYYAIADYTAVNPEFGTMEEFKSLVQKIQDMGMYVVLDWVANHTGWDHKWINEHPEWYAMNGDTIRHPYGHDGNPTDWYDTAELNYDNADMRQAMIDAMIFWVKDVNIDGFRCDVADNVPNDFWATARKALDVVKPVFMLAEAESEPDHFNSCFNANYGWSFHHLLNQVAKGEKNASDIMTAINNNNSRFPEHYFQMHFTSNHDENSWNGTAPERMGSAEDAMTVIAFTVPGMPLIYSGQESGETKRLAFFEKDQIDWGNYSRAAFYQKLLNLKSKNKALWNGPFGGAMKRVNSGNEVLAFAREKDGDVALIIVNLTDKNQSTDVSVHYHDLVNLFSGERIDIHDKANFNIGPYGYLVFSAEGLEEGHHHHH